MKQFLRNDQQGFLTLYALFLLSILLMAGMLFAQRISTLSTLHNVSNADLFALYKVKEYVRRYEPPQEEQVLLEEAEENAAGSIREEEEREAAGETQIYEYDGYHIEICYEQDHAVCSFSSLTDAFSLTVAYDLSQGSITSYSYE